MYRERNFFTFIGGIIAALFAVNAIFSDAVSTAHNLAWLADWVREFKIDLQINLFMRYILFLLDAYSIPLLIFGFLFLVLWKK